jgi:hypothetical protein
MKHHRIRMKIGIGRPIINCTSLENISAPKNKNKYIRVRVMLHTFDLLNYLGLNWLHDARNLHKV